MPAVRLATVILFCADVPRLAAFYRDRLGLTPTAETSEGWTVLTAGSVEIGLHRIPDEHLPGSRADFQVENNVKLVFEVEDVDTLRTALNAQGVEIGEVRQFPGHPYRTADGRDPEGNVFQLASRSLA